MNRTDLKYLFFSLNLWLSPLSIFMVVITAMALETSLNMVPVVALLPFFLFYVIYVEDRRSPETEDQINHPKRSALVQKYNSFLRWSEFAGIIIYQFLLISLGIKVHLDTHIVIILGQIPFVIISSYGLVKQYPLLDSIAVGFTWAYMAVFPVHLLSNEITLGQSLPIFSAWFIITFAGSESRNLDDIEGDDKAAKPTLAGWLDRPIAPLVVVCLKLIGLSLFWIYTTQLITGLVIAYLLLLRIFRELTRYIQ